MLARLAPLLCLVLACDKGPSRNAEANTTVAPAVAPTDVTPPAVEGKVFGAGVTLAETVEVSALLADPSAYKGKVVRVEGMVTDVCPKRGCWFMLAGTEPGQKLRFKVDDGEMVFPPDAKGQHAVAQGVVAVRELTIEETRAQAEYQAKEYGMPYDPASITAPTTSVRIDGTGAVLRAKK